MKQTNKREQKIMDRVVEALGAVPGTGGHGSNSSTIHGYVTYHKDMETVSVAVLQVLRRMAYPFGYEADDINDEIEEYLTKAEQYIEKRKAEQWR